MDFFQRLVRSEIDVEQNAVSFCVYVQNHDCLRELKERIYQVLDPFLQSYVWQKDEFLIHISTEEPVPWSAPSTDQDVLWGCVRYGDSVEDEWFIVALLWKLTQCFPSIAVRIWDDDGEFLLIEAAFVLPKWIKPETSINRVWIKEGAIHIIPKEYPKNANMENLTALEALDILSSNIKTRAKGKIQQCIEDRMGNFPEDTLVSQHWARCYLPLKAAHLLAQNRGIISAAVGHLTDQENVKNVFSKPCLYFKDQEFVMTMVKFHRSSYARLIQMDLSPEEDTIPNEVRDLQSKSKMIGFKVLCALEGYLQSSFSASSQFGCFSSLSFELLDAFRKPFKTEILVEEFLRENSLFAEDDDSWLYNGQDDLEKELLKRGKEQKTTKGLASEGEELDPNMMVTSFSEFVDNISSHEGAEIPDNISFNPHLFMNELSKAFGDELSQEMKHLAISNSDNMTSSETEEEEEEGDTLFTSTDSDDEEEEEEEEEFNEAYDEALKCELSQSKMSESFVKKMDNAEALTTKELDLDMNLVQNLVQSYEEEQSQVGPVSSLAGLMKLDIPHKQQTSSIKGKHKT